MGGMGKDGIHEFNSEKEKEDNLAMVHNEGRTISGWWSSEVTSAQSFWKQVKRPHWNHVKASQL